MRAAIVTLSRSRRAIFWVLFGVVLCAHLSACNPDPTSGGFTFNFRNDTDRGVLIRYCDNSRCSKVDWEERVAPSERLPANSAAEDFDEWYQFRDATTNDVIGCTTLHFKRPVRHLVIPISSSTACPSI